MANETTTTPSPTDDIKKFWLAIAFVGLSVIGIVLLAVILLINTPDADKNKAAQTIFSAILPLLGTWVGAILAYYFGTKQVEASQQQQSRALDMMSRQVEHHRSLAENAQSMLQSQLTNAQAGK